jgi:predicted nuclease with TOPRIM domain
MNVKELDAELREIERTKAELSKLDYNDPKYDDLEEQLHDLEDDFQDKHGEYLEEALQNVHDELCPDNDVLMPIAYLGDGVPVEIDQYAGKDTRLILATNPPRILLAIGNEKQDVVWVAES